MRNKKGSVTFGSVFVASDQQLESQSGRLRSSAEACLDTILKSLEKKDWKSLEIPHNLRVLSSVDITIVNGDYSCSHHPVEILWMEEILHQLVAIGSPIKHCKQ